ncbi:hypothetical protein GWK47_020661 [Chionoecetes opilio]|uniref:Uncharacterized protein n=1 Tax=Chionoecetes opilio TaxID=41210 RepID=A0A8J5CKR8_CHIOP|nr:hypothetical protein GWK47_020661 [Chionoecetes opilio]
MPRAGLEVDPEPLRGIETFVRDILPRHPRATPEGGSSPVPSDPGFEEPPCDNAHLKRKSCLVAEESADSDEADSEHLPSSKRQRITVSAMRRLFAKCNLSDTCDASQPATPEGSGRAASAPPHGASTPQHCPRTAAASESDTEGAADENRSRQNNHPDQSSPVTERSDKRISDKDSGEEHGDKRQRTTKRGTDRDKKEKGGKRATNKEKKQPKEDRDAEKTDNTVATTSEDVLKNNKRQAETQESDTEDKRQPDSKVKRTRRLRRGLKLCSNITCYIKQVLYN